MATGMTFSTDTWVEMMSGRDMAGIELMKIADEGQEFALILSEESQIAKSKLGQIAQKYPDRVFDVGIAEMNGIGVAAGLALSGKVTFFQCFGPFLASRVDQIYNDVAYNDVPVRLIGTHSGLTSGGGPTHYTVTDIAIMRAIPNMTVIVPGDANQAARFMRIAMTYPGPMYIRLPRADIPMVYENQDYKLEIGKAVTAKEGTDITVIGVATGLSAAVAASNRLEDEGISVRVLDMHTVKPLDTEAILKAAAETKGIITVEDHSIVGGLGGAVTDTLAMAGACVKVKKLGIPDEFAALGYPEELYAYYGYDAEGIMREVRAMLGVSAPPPKDIED